MKVEVKLYTAGKVHYEIVQAVDYDQAKRTAQARNPFSTVLSCNAKF